MAAFYLSDQPLFHAQRKIPDLYERPRLTPDCRKTEPSDVDRYPVAVKRNDTAFRGKVKGKERGVLYRHANIIMKLSFHHAREANAAGPAFCIRFAEDGNCYLGHEKTACYIWLW